MDMPPPFPSSVPPPPPKKGLPPLAWVGIGCGALLLIGLVAVGLSIGWVVRKVDEVQQDMATAPRQDAATAVDEVLPGIEIVNHDDLAGTVTFRQAGQVEDSTLSLDDFLAGKFTIVRPDGSEVPAGSGFPDVPAWVPRYPRVREQGGVFVDTDPSGTEGVILFSTDDAPDDVADHYQSTFGRTANHTSTSFSIGSSIQLSRTLSGGGKTLTLEVSGEASKPSSVIVKFSDR